ncbi:hypothetical protein WICPIJ_008945 [Wickerhamomyces pijperi]|uniref:Uncharacterized protein n=1 Tax=Wickerhamomyces pijperi TaxID=599730 RepID=A0A9P8TGB8_WICPI|nr:hypothetical protein WICPIJ_008945 [Wickerhamomyces pijperi]
MQDSRAALTDEQQFSEQDDHLLNRILYTSFNLSLANGAADSFGKSAVYWVADLMIAPLEDFGVTEAETSGSSATATISSCSFTNSSDSIPQISKNPIDFFTT